MTLAETLHDFIVSTHQMFQETAAQFRETDARFKENAAQFKETDRKIDKLQGLFSSQWGRLVEAMVAPAALALFQQQGIEVIETMQRVVVKRGGLNKEFDIILVNGDVVVVAEVKSTLKVDDVRAHQRCLEHFFDYMPEHRGKRVLGAMACISSDERAEQYAASHGFFVIGLTGDNLVCIRNPPDFVPRDFGTSAAG
jgi:hypothetical protein